MGEEQAPGSRGGVRVQGRGKGWSAGAGRVCIYDTPNVLSLCSTLETPQRNWGPRANLLPGHRVGEQSIKACREK